MFLKGKEDLIQTVTCELAGEGGVGDTRLQGGGMTHWTTGDNVRSSSCPLQSPGTCFKVPDLLLPESDLVDLGPE